MFVFHFCQHVFKRTKKDAKPQQGHFLPSTFVKSAVQKKSFIEKCFFFCNAEGKISDVTFIDFHSICVTGMNQK